MYDFYRDCYSHTNGISTVDWRALRRGDSTELMKLVLAPRPPHPAVGAATSMQVPCIDSDGASTWLNNPVRAFEHTVADGLTL